MHYFSNKFSNRQALGAFRPKCPLTFNVVDLKFRDLAKIVVVEAGYDKIELQNIVMA